jgi:hypothetical protein
MARSQRTKLTLGDLGTPALVKTLSPEDLAKRGGKLIMGRLIGMASKMIERKSLKNPDEIFEGLGGSFRSIPNKDAPNPAEAEELESGALFIPDAFHNMIADRLKAAKAANPDDNNVNVRFAFDICAVPAKNPAGYSWDFRPLIDSDTLNPLDDLANSVAQIAQGAAAKQIEHKAPAKK